MSVNRTKKIILKTRRQKEDKYVGDGREIKQNVISETFLGNTNENNKNKKIQNNEEEQLKNNWDDIEKSEMDLERELALWKSKLEAEKIKSAENINLINNELKEKNRKLKIVTTNNYKLFLKLKNIQNGLKENYLKKINQRLKKRDINTKNEETLKKDIIIMEEIIKIVQKFGLEEKKQKIKYEKLINEFDNGFEQNINDDLKKLNDEIKQLNENILELSRIKMIHSDCSKYMNSLKNKLSLYNTELEFESKRSDMLVNQSFQTKNNLNISTNKSNNNIFRESNDGSFIINKNNYSMEIRKLILSKSIKKPEKLNISTYNYINQKFYSINKTPNKELILHNINKKNINLFSEGEYNVLKEIIPSKYMTKYLEEFESKKKKNEEIENIFESQKKEKGQTGQIKIKLDYIEVKKKEEDKKHIDLSLKFKTNNKKINELKNEIKKYKAEFKKYGKIIKFKEKFKNALLVHKKKIK